MTKYNSRTVLSKNLTDVVYNSAQQLNTKVYQSKIRASISIQEAQTQSSDLLTYANSNAQLDYKQFIEEFLPGLNHEQK